jgi:hypothetical protein
MKIKSLLILVTVALFAISCGGNRAKSVTAEAVVEVETLLASATEYVDKIIEVEAICTHICQHGARKIFLMGSDETKTIRIESGDLGAFDQKCQNSIVKVIGTLCEERIDEAYLQNWEAAVAAKSAEQHGDGESGCETEKKARGETGSTTAERIADFRAKIAARKAAEGKEYLSFYYVVAQAYEVLK